MNELTQYLKSYFFVPDESVEVMRNLFQVVDFQKGDFLTRKGRFVNGLYFVSEGIFRVYDEKKDKEVTQWIGTKGHFLTDIRGLAFDQPANWNIMALTESTCHFISMENYRKIGTLVPNWYELENRFLAACFITLEERIYQFLSSSAEERYTVFLDENRALFNEVPLQYIASMLGMSPETLSRIRAKIK